MHIISYLCTKLVLNINPIFFKKNINAKEYEGKNMKVIAMEIL